MQLSILSRGVKGALFVATFPVPFLNTVAFAQNGDRPGHKMVEVWRDMDVPPAPVLSPEEALKSFALQPGYLSHRDRRGGAVGQRSRDREGR